MFTQLSCSFHNEWLSFRYDFCFRTIATFFRKIVIPGVPVKGKKYCQTT